MTYVPIYKHQFTITVLSEAETYEPDLFTIAYAITDGDDIGLCEHVSVDCLNDPQQVRNELVAIGNDGTFFDFDNLYDDNEEEQENNLEHFERELNTNT